MIKSVFGLIKRLVTKNETVVARPIVAAYSRNSKEYRKALDKLAQHGIQVVEPREGGEVGIDFLVICAILAFGFYVVVGVGFTSLPSLFATLQIAEKLAQIGF
jgi:hypothetical protein